MSLSHHVTTTQNHLTTSCHNLSIQKKPPYMKKNAPPLSLRPVCSSDNPVLSSRPVTISPYKKPL